MLYAVLICSPLSEVEHGRIRYESMEATLARCVSLGCRARYVCGTGYKLTTIDGQVPDVTTRTCVGSVASSIAVWDGTDLTCSPLSKLVTMSMIVFKLKLI